MALPPLFAGVDQFAVIEVPLTVAFGAVGESGVLGKVTDAKIPAVDAPTPLVATI